MEVVVRRLSDPVELEEAVEVHARAWGSRDYREVVAPHILRALVDNGGLVLGAFVGGRMVGASYGWFVGCGEGRYFYSHATGVEEGYKYRGVGFALKARQREEVLREGVSLAKWTFDPLQSLNTRFNLAKLGAVYRVYKVNYYGEMTDEINRGLGSDRVVAEWWLDSRLVGLKLEGRLRPPPAEELKTVYGAVEALAHGDDGYPRPREAWGDAEVALVALPRSITVVREELGIDAARRWRMATRKAITGLLSKGYIAVDHTFDSSGRSYAVFVKSGLRDVLEARLPWAR
ncbi:conserved hypothetical protein [Aeropyrum pernix K1]|uniref:N-acetyltransferase domain-containing protein n=1 Tax=Aeropyrum pernix (strain ATCC 700893 / DSM 11879 / JCM 9820 / NBRC 100138 / K1) TaxID=272557 RepID=Q9YBR5_AERPE|nr:hypothetical protein [Aeropyrum pernix]BAA80533.1 conserved hypothetical protein [Aeropyrum pernix K1]